MRRSIRTWLGIALTGQAVFAAYVILFYGRTAIEGAPERWNKVMPHGWVEGQTADNAVLAAHLAASVALLIAGMLQLSPAIRQRWRSLHRWNGRVYLLAASVLSLGGLWLVWGRGGAAGDVSQHLAISGNALIIVGCAVAAWRAAAERRFDSHRRWALRTFVAALGVWYFRIGLMAWLGVWQAPVGFDVDSFSGPFLTVLAWSVYVVVPLTVLELVLRAERSTRSEAHTGVAVLMGGLSLLTLFGVFMATLGMWWPRMH